MQLVYLSIQNIHELLQLALHVALLLSTVVYVDLQTSYPPLQLAVLRLCSLLVDKNNKKTSYITASGEHRDIRFIYFVYEDYKAVKDALGNVW